MSLRVRILAAGLRSFLIHGHLPTRPTSYSPVCRLWTAIARRFLHLMASLRATACAFSSMWAPPARNWSAIWMLLWLDAGFERLMLRCRAAPLALDPAN